MKFFKWRLWISKDFLKTLKVKKLVWPWRLGIHWRNMKREDFCFYSSIFSFLSHRKHRTVKEGRGNTKEKFLSDAQLKSYTYQSLRVKPLEISYSSINFFSDSVGVLGTGVPRLARLRPTAWLCKRARTAHLHQWALKTLARRMTQDLLGSGLTRLAREGQRVQGQA